MLLHTRASGLTRRCMLSIPALFAALVCARVEADVRVRCHTAFDTDYFYVAADVEKPVLRGSVAAPFGDPLSDDAFLIGIGVPNEPNRRVEMAVSVAQGAQLYRGADRKPLGGIGDFLTASDGTRMVFKYRLRLKGKLNADPDFANGFTVEVAIPWIEVGGPPQQGERRRLSVAVTNTVQGEAPIVALSPAITSLDHARDMAKWSEVVFVDAPTPSVAAAPGAIVCARVYNVKPVIDGAPAEGEWTRVTAFAFGSGMEAMGPLPAAASVARSRTPLQPKQAPPPPHEGRWLLPREGEAPAEPLKPLAAQAWPRLVFARYLVDRQADARKPLPLAPVADATGRSLLVTHPMDGTGPWMSYDRIDWHRIQMTRMREAGVDVAAVTYRPGRQGRLAVTALGSALAALEGSDADRPTVCLWLDAGAIESSDEGLASALYAAIREFHQCLLARFAASVPLSEANGGGLGTPIIISGLSPSKLEAAARARDEIRARFLNEFGRDAIMLAVGSGEGWDGLVTSSGESAYSFDGTRPIHVASVFAGAPGRKAGEHPLLRRSSDTYRSAWRSAVTDNADWVVIESWNDYAAASEIGPTIEYGLEYVDITQAFGRLWRRSRNLSGYVVSSTVVSDAPWTGPRTVRLDLRNTGTEAWLPGVHGVRIGWVNGRGSVVGAMPKAVDMGGICSVSVRVPAPEKDGMQVLRVSLVRLDKNGAPVVSGQGASADLAEFAVLSSAASGSAGASPSWAASLVTEQPLRVAEGASLHTIGITVRNDGSTAWSPGEAIVRVRLFEQAPTDPEPRYLDMADASAPIATQVPAGEEAAVQVPIAFVRPDGTPFRLSENSDARYLIRSEIVLTSGSPAAVVLGCQEVQIVEADFGPQFFNDFTPAELPGDRRVSVVIGVRNRGPQTWLKGKVAVGYHWYYLDGVEAVWQDEVFPINVDMAPGSQIADVGAWITAPPHDGVYWLVWDVRVGDAWCSTALSARAYETRVQLVRVVRGRLQFVDLSGAANATVTAALGDPPQKGLDGSGTALPAELTPPFASGMPVCTTLWQPVTRTGPDINRRISFRWLPRAKPNGVRCQGQTLTVAAPRQATQARTVHVLAAATRKDATMGVTLRFSNGSEQYTSFPVGMWNKTPANGEEVAHALPFTRPPDPTTQGPPAQVFRYAIAVRERTPLLSIQLSETPEVVVFGISVER